MIDEPEFQALSTKDAAGAGKSIAEFLAAPERTREDSSRADFRRRFLGLALEAYRREEITRSKLEELSAMVGMRREGIRAALISASLD